MDQVTASVLLVTADATVRAAVARLAAAANVVVEPLPLPALAGRWRTGAAVLVGEDAVAEVLDQRLGRRQEVWVVAPGPASDHLLRGALALGACGVLELPADADALRSWLADLGDRDSPPRGHVVGVLGASGGVGASVLALALAEVAAATCPALLVDLDPWGLPAGALAGVPAPAGTEATSWTDLAALEGRVGARALRESLPARHHLRVLGWGAGPAVLPALPVVREVVGAARRGHDWVVLDVPRSADTPGLLGLCDAVVVVVAPTLAGTAGAARVRGLVPPGVAAGVAVRHSRGAWSDDAARLTGLPLWTELGTQRGLDEHLAAGLGAVRSRRSPCARAAVRVLGSVGAAVGEGGVA